MGGLGAHGMKIGTGGADWRVVGAHTHASGPAGPSCPCRGPPSSSDGQGESQEGPLALMHPGDGVGRVEGWGMLWARAQRDNAAMMAHTPVAAFPPGI